MSAAEAVNPSSLVVALCVGPGALARFGRVIRHLVVGLFDQAVTLRVISSDRRVESLSLGPVQVITHEPLRRPFVRHRIRQVIDELEAQPPAVVHAMSDESYGLGSAVAEAFDADLVVGVTSLADCDALDRLQFNRGAHAAVFSEPLFREVSARSGPAGASIEVIRPGVLAAGQTAYRAVSDRVSTLVCTSPFHRDSGLERLLEALSILKVRGRTYLAFLLGEGLYEQSLRRAARGRGLSSCVIFSHPAGELVPALGSGDIFVWPSAEDRFRVDVLAAMAEGLSVVTMPCPVCDHLHDGKTVALCASPTADALADSLDRILEDSAYGQQIAFGGQQYVREHHSVSGMAEKLAALYRRLALPRTTFSLHR